MIVTFLILALIYTTLEVTYWYYRWWQHLGKEPLPIVKSLLLAVAYAHSIFFLNIALNFCTGAGIFTNPISSALVLTGVVAHLIPIWKQKVSVLATPCMYLLRVVVFSIAGGYLATS